MSRHIGLAVVAAIMVAGCQPAVRVQSREEAEVIEQTIEAKFGEDVALAERMALAELIPGVDDRYKAGFIQDGVYYKSFSKLMMEQMPQAGKFKGQKINVAEKKITVLADDIAMLTAAGDFTATLKSGESFSGRFVWTFVYAKIDGRWKVIHSHQSRPN